MCSQRWEEATEASMESEGSQYGSLTIQAGLHGIAKKEKAFGIAKKEKMLEAQI